MLSAIPEATEQQAKGKPPVGAGRLVIHRGSRLEKLSCYRLIAVAFAYPYVTRQGASGQRTGRVHVAQDVQGASQ